MHVADRDVSGPPPSSRRPIDARLARALLALAGAGLVTGAALHLAGGGMLGDRAWEGSGALGAIYSRWTMVDTLWRTRAGVDVIALLALVGALAVGEDLAAAVISVMLASGRALEGWAAGRARHDLRALLERAPRSALRYADGGIETVPLTEVVPGDRLMVGTGELVPVDGNLLVPAVLDESALTGESLPVERRAREPVRGGVSNAGAPFDLRATAGAAESTYSGIVRLVRQAEASEPPLVRLADRYALAFLGLTLAAAGAAWAFGGATRAVAVLVVATPCPLILAAPVALVAGLSQAPRPGVVVKSGAVLERLAACTTLLFDKTGTLTAGRPRVGAVVSAGLQPADEVLSLAASLDQVAPVSWPARWCRRRRPEAAPSNCPSRWWRCRGRGSVARSVVTGRPCHGRVADSRRLHDASTADHEAPGPHAVAGALGAGERLAGE